MTDIDYKALADRIREKYPNGAEYDKWGREYVVAVVMGELVDALESLVPKPVITAAEREVGYVAQDARYPSDTFVKIAENSWVWLAKNRHPYPDSSAIVLYRNADIDAKTYPSSE